MSERARNPRGQGARLREEVLTVAADMLEEEGPRGLSLRAIARRVGVSAPALYAHFDDVDVIVATVVDRTFDDLAVALAQAIDHDSAPADRLRACCLAYVTFARTLPGRYAILFGPGISEPSEPAKDIGEMTGAHAFGVLRSAVRNHLQPPPGAGDAQVMTEATTLWCALHGYVTLSNRSPAFPWPTAERYVDSMIQRMAVTGPPVASGQKAVGPS